MNDDTNFCMTLSIIIICITIFLSIITLSITYYETHVITKYEETSAPMEKK